MVEASAALVRGFRPCAVVPTYENPTTIDTVVSRLHEHVDPIVVVDDGSGPATRHALAELARGGRCHVVRRGRNGGKGAAVKAGLRWARDQGCTHALQVDADLQHELDDVPALLEAARARPEALVLGAPIYGEDAPAGRRIGRELTRFWTRLEAGTAIGDPMCGFRVYPVAAATAVEVAGNRMDFDIEIVVRLCWHGVPVVHVPTRVHYPADGVSHFRMVRDNLSIAWLHTRLMTRKVLGLRPRPTAVA